MDPKDGTNAGYDEFSWRPTPRREKRESTTPDPVNEGVLAALRQRAEARVQDEVAKRLDQLDALGADALPDGAVVAFTKRHTEDGHAFSYAALRIAGHWYLTGAVNGSKKTNDEFCAWLVSGEGFTDYEVLRGMEAAPTSS